MSDYTDLIAALVGPQPADEYRNPIDMFREAAEAIEALVKERDDLKREMHARELHHFEEEQRSVGFASSTTPKSSPSAETPTGPANAATSSPPTNPPPASNTQPSPQFSGVDSSSLFRSR